MDIKSKLGGAPVAVFISLLILVLIAALFIVGNFSSGNSSRMTGMAVNDGVLDEGECMLTTMDKCIAAAGGSVEKIVETERTDWIKNLPPEIQYDTCDGVSNVQYLCYGREKNKCIDIKVVSGFFYYSYVTCKKINFPKEGVIALLELSSARNAHGESYPGLGYNNVVCCKTGGDANIYCNAQNTLIYLSGSTNAHGSLTTSTGYAQPICVAGGNALFEGKATGQDCSANMNPLLYLSGDTNAHLEYGKLSNNKYTGGAKVCTSLGVEPYVEGCDYTTRSTCLAEGNDCTWTPNGKKPAEDNGNCCPKGERWMDGECTGTGLTCNSPWKPGVENSPGNNVANNPPPAGGDYPWEYNCAKIASGTGSLGIWDKVVPYS